MDLELVDRLLDFVHPYLPAPQALYQPRGTGRADLWSELVASRRGTIARHCLLIGATGAGKSTELGRLATQRMKAVGGPAVILLRLQDQTVPEQLSAGQVLFLLGVAALRSVGQTTPPDLVRELQAAYGGVVEPMGSVQLEVSVDEIMKRMTLVLSEALATLGDAVGATAAAAASALVGHAARNLPVPGRGLFLSANDPQVTLLAEAVNRAVAWAKKAHGRSVEFFVDGLDRLDFKNINAMFGAGVLNQVEAPTVFAAPIAVAYDSSSNNLDKFFKMLPLGNFPIFQSWPDGAHDEEGFEAMRELVLRRLRAADVSPEDILEDGGCAGGILDAMIDASGGLPHALLTFFNSALRDLTVYGAPGQTRLSREGVEETIQGYRREAVRRLDLARISVIADSWRRRKRPTGEGADKLLFDNVILAYPNGYPWYRPSPLIIPYLRMEFPHHCPQEPDEGPRS